MALRFDDANRLLELSVRDLVEAGAPKGDLALDLAWSSRARMAAGRDAHTVYQAGRATEDLTFQAEVRVRRQIAVAGWTVVLTGRADGVSEHDGRTVVEEIKSTALDGARLLPTTLDDWPEYAAQLRIYLWMLADARHPDPLGRLVFVSLVDGARHVLGVALDHDGISAYIHAQLRFVVEERERRLAWLGRRRAVRVPEPFPEWRPGQREIADKVKVNLDFGRQILAQAPTGLGKTAAILYGALRHALAHDKQVFWATARTTQQLVVLAMLDRFREAGLPLRVVTISAREKACLNDVVACRADRCRFAAGYYDKLGATGIIDEVLADNDGRAETIRALGARAEVCPYELALDATDHVDVVVGDYNYVFDPSVQLRRLFSTEPGRWVVIVDEAHQLVDRARGYGSPRVEARHARAARRQLAERDPEGLEPFLILAGDVLDAILEGPLQATGRSRDGVSEARLDVAKWRDFADRLDEIALDYVRLSALAPPVAADAWLELARAVQRFVRALEAAGDDTVHLVGDRPGEEFTGLLCLDPSPWLGPRLAGLGGFVACSATLSPPTFYRDLLGLDPQRLETSSTPSFFPTENRRILVATGVSTAFRDRRADAARTATIIERCIAATPGNVAVYFPSFAMLQDIVRRLDVDREVLAQRPSMPDADRERWLRRIAGGGQPVVLAAVLGGIFAEGIDLPGGALRAVIVAGPALPPVGLERDLLRHYYQARYGTGFRYASLVPGMTRVVQAAGRLLRSAEDRGVVVLVDRRFQMPEIAELLPEEWTIDASEDPSPAVAAFWSGA